MPRRHSSPQHSTMIRNCFWYIITFRSGVSDCRYFSLREILKQNYLATFRPKTYIKSSNRTFRHRKIALLPVRAGSREVLFRYIILIFRHKILSWSISKMGTFMSHDKSLSVHKTGFADWNAWLYKGMRIWILVSLLKSPQFNNQNSQVFFRAICIMLLPPEQ